MRIPINEIRFSSLSLMDSGHLFRWQGRIYRAIKPQHSAAVKQLFMSGLIEALVGEGVFIPSKITEFELEGYGLIVEHDVVRVVTYPHEWCYSMLKQAALLALRVNEIAAGYGYQTYDCHGYNVLFDGERPLYVDLGSFTPYRTRRKELLSYDEFLRGYLYPLTLWASFGSALGRRMVPRPGFLLSTEDYLRLRWGMFKPPFADAIGRLLSKLHRFYAIREEVFLAYKGRHPGWKIFLVSIIRKFGTFVASIEELRRHVSRIRRREERTLWSNYHDSFVQQDGQVALSTRLRHVADILLSSGICSVLEIAGNQGVLSRQLKRMKSDLLVTCTDVDEHAVDKGYCAGVTEKTGVHWAVLNPFFSEYGSTEESPTTRYCADAVVALALSHHLILSQGIPLAWFLDVLSRFSNKLVLVEFMPLGLFNGETAPPVPSWYTADWFQKEFEARFTLVSRTQTEKNRILFVGEKRADMHDVPVHLPA